MIFKRVSGLLVIFVFLLNSVGCGMKKETEELKIGITIYKQEDKFISYIIKEIEEYAVKKENETGKKITVNIVDAKGNTTAQNNQVDKFLSQDYDVICVNIVDRTAAAMIINKAKKSDVPVIFFNREPVEEDIKLWDKVYYVGAKAEMSGNIQGKIIADEYYKNKELVDKNNDDKIQYVMLEGEPEHQDSLIRTESTIKTLVTRGIDVEKLADDSANWQNAQAYEKISQWINEYGDSIEVVFSNNDDMAIGAIRAYENANIPLDERPLIVGIDGIPEALVNIKEGKMKGTVFNNYKIQADEIIDISYDLWNEKNLGINYNNKRDRYFKYHYEIITEENLDAYLKE